MSSTPYPCKQVPMGAPFTNPCRTSLQCNDPYTAYGYWRRRFNTDYAYLTCYYYPYADRWFYPNGYVFASQRSSDCSATTMGGAPCNSTLPFTN